MKEKPSSNLSRLKSELERRLIIMRYSKVSTKKYMKVFGWLEDYLNGYGETNYTKELGQRYLIEYPLQAIHAPSKFKEAQVTIRRLDEILENSLFAPRFSTAHSVCPQRFTSLLDRFIENMVKRGYSKKTVVNSKTNGGRLLSQIGRAHV